MVGHTPYARVYHIDLGRIPFGHNVFDEIKVNFLYIIAIILVFSCTTVINCRKTYFTLSFSVTLNLEDMDFDIRYKLNIYGTNFSKDPYTFFVLRNVCWSDNSKVMGLIYIYIYIYIYVYEESTRFNV